VITWLELPETPIPAELHAAVGGHPLVSAVLARRGHADPEEALAFLDPDRYQPASPLELPGMEAAVQRLLAAVSRGERVCVWGDFDVDGQTATTVLVSALRELGGVVDFHIPVRARESHGVNLPELKRIIREGAELILTCDTGIAAHDPVDYARSQGVDVIVTDHHDLPDELPDALAIINPKLLPADHPLAALPGVGVAYELSLALFAAGKLAKKEKDALLDLVALGVVADLAVQSRDTRFLLQRGLERLRNTERLGLQVLMDLAEVNQERLSEEHIAFVLAPRLNALGRLSDANAAVEFLTTNDLSRARILATDLEGLNARRKLLTDQVFEGALAQIERDPGLLERAALVLSHAAWPAGVIGIVASRLVERFGRPVVLLAAPPGELARGSARSLPGCNISAAIADQGELLESYGGHPMAAGLSIAPERIPDFREGLSRSVAAQLAEAAFEPRLQIDGYLRLDELSLELVEDLERLAPFGPGNPPLTLATRDLSLVSQTLIGRNDEHRQLLVEDDAENRQQVLWWDGAGWELPKGRFDLAYSVRASDYRGQREVQVEWIEARAVGPPVEVEADKPVLQLVDHRGAPAPLETLGALLARGDLQVWCEGGDCPPAGLNRTALEPAAELAIWSLPPGRGALRAALHVVQPRTVYLFDIDPGMDHLEAYLKRLAGLVKYALSANAGRVELSALAAACAQREVAARKGVAWLAARGHCAVLDESEGVLTLSRAGSADEAEAERLAWQLHALLAESAAYRAFFARAELEILEQLLEQA